MGRSFPGVVDDWQERVASFAAISFSSQGAILVSAREATSCRSQKNTDVWTNNIGRLGAYLRAPEYFPTLISILLWIMLPMCISSFSVPDHSSVATNRPHEMVRPTVLIPQRGTTTRERGRHGSREVRIEITGKIGGYRGRETREEEGLEGEIPRLVLER